MFPDHCSDACRPRCVVPQCDELGRYRSDHGRLCPAHRSYLQRNGRLPERPGNYDRSPPPETCRQCGGPRGAGYWKWFCSPRCYGRNRAGIDESLEWPCAECGSSISIRTSRRDAKRCEWCRTTRPAMTARQLAERDGPTCGLCREPVDMTLSGRDLMGPVADHIIPRAHRGPNTPENLQLAHLVCNARKQDRIAV